jgi:hypothetical protein
MGKTPDRGSGAGLLGGLQGARGPRSPRGPRSRGWAWDHGLHGDLAELARGCRNRYPLWIGAPRSRAVRLARITARRAYGGDRCKPRGCSYSVGKTSRNTRSISTLALRAST